jgi:DNA-binding beta-propeller fold protein YncE
VVAVAADARGSTWVLNEAGVHRLSPRGDGPSQPIDGQPVAVELDADRVWVLDVVGDELVLRNFHVDGSPEALTETVGPAQVGEDDSEGALAVDAGEAWVSDGRGTLARLPPGQGQLEEVEEVDGDVVDVALEGPWAWAATAQGSLLRIDRTSLAVTEVEVSRHPLVEVVAAGGVAWTADAEGEVRRVPADATDASAALPLDEGRKVLAAADDGSAVYVANAGTGQVDRLDADSGRADDARRIDLTDALG